MRMKKKKRQNNAGLGNLGLSKPPRAFHVPLGANVRQLQGA
jgi:hypothetical protein